MQTLSEIRQLLESAGLKPHKRFGQNFLIDRNLMAKLLELAEASPGDSVLEVGPGTGSLTEELLDHGCDVLAVEIDKGLCGVLRQRLGDRPGFGLHFGDILAGKHAICPAVLDALPERCMLVSNLPYNVATSVVAQCMVSSWRREVAADSSERVFGRLVFTVQKELADRLLAGPGGCDYGPVSVLVSLLASKQAGPVLGPQSFWPRPKVRSQMVRLDFNGGRARDIPDLELLQVLVRKAFGHRRKKLSFLMRCRDAPWSASELVSAMDLAGVDADLRPEQVPPAGYLSMAAALAQNT